MGFILPGRPEARILMGEKPLIRGHFLKYHRHARYSDPGHGDHFLAAVPAAVDVPRASLHSTPAVTDAVA
jgi:hypothetical protein